MKDSKLIKETGATFTPKSLADFLSKQILSYSNTENPLVLDPACGNGALLLSIGQKLELLHRNFSLLGFDTNEEYLTAANKILHDNIRAKYILEPDDFLEKINVSELSLNFNKETSFINNKADIVIANPPYVRTQVLGAEKAQHLAKKFGLKGRVDLYYPFLIAITHALKENGLLGVITSNRYLFTKSGASVRKFLFENYEILKVIDLGDTKLFDAAVLPAIFIGRKKRGSQNKLAKFSKIYEELNGYKGDFQSYENIFNILNSPAQGFFTDGTKNYKKSSGIVKFSKTKENNWAMLSDKEADWVQKIENNAKELVSDSFKVRVGIKTTADKVFISDTWDKLNGTKPEEEHLKDLISQENIQPWGTSDKKKLKVLYPHFSKNGTKSVIDIEKYPKTKKYFLLHEKTLKGRKYVIDSGRNWFEIWVPQKPELWKYPKIVFPDISASPRFCFDTSGKIVNGNCYWITGQKPEDEQKLLLIQGIANSKLMTKYHDLVFSNKLYSGRRRYFSQYVQNYPLPDVQSKEAQEIIKTVKKLNNCQNETTIDTLSNILETQIAQSFQVPTVNSLD